MEYIQLLFPPFIIFLYDVWTYEKRGSHEIIYLQTHEKNHSKTLRFLYSIDFLILVTRGLIFTMYWKWRFLKRKQTLLPFVVDFHDWRFHKDFSTIFRGLTYNLFYHTLLPIAQTLLLFNKIKKFVVCYIHRCKIPC